jgi:hypothetical protein
MFQQRTSKYGAQRTTFQGNTYDSKFEAGVAQQLDKQKAAGEILDWERQYHVVIWCHRPDGVAAFNVKHKVDFRIHHKDGSYELVEAKGVETADYKMRRKFLEEIWLPMNLDHTYTVVKQARYYKSTK